LLFRYDPESDTLTMSMAVFKKNSVGTLGRLSLRTLNLLCLLHLKQYDKDGEEYLECNNLTLINLTLKVNLVKGFL